MALPLCVLACVLAVPSSFAFEQSADPSSVTIAPRIRAVRVEGTVASLPTEPLTLGETESFDALCSDAGSWIRIRAPERVCGFSWVRASYGSRYIYLPWLRRVRKVDKSMWAEEKRFGIPVSLRELFNVVCQTADVPLERARFITIGRRSTTEITADEVLLNGLIDSVALLGCTDKAGIPKSET